MFLKRGLEMLKVHGCFNNDTQRNLLPLELCE